MYMDNLEWYDMWNENPMKVYAKKHPGCSLQEYCDHLDREEQERRDAKKREEGRGKKRGTI